MTELTFKQLIQKTIKVISVFQKVEQREWGIEANMVELSKQVGDLAKNVMMLENYYLAERSNNPEYNKASKEAIGGELADILFMIIRIADYYEIDLEKAHIKELDIATKFFKER